MSNIKDTFSEQTEILLSVSQPIKFCSQREATVVSGLDFLSPLNSYNFLNLHKKKS